MNQLARKKKIVFVYDAIYPYIKGGAERRYYEVGKRLALQGYDVHLVGMKLWDGPDVIQKEGMTLHGIASARSLYTASGRRSISQAILFGIACLKLFKEEFDIIDCCGFPYFSLFSCKLVTMVKGKKLYSTWHEVWGREYWNEYLGRLGIFGYLVEKMTVTIPDQIISVSEMTAERLRNEFNYSKRIIISPNGIDLEHIQKIKPSKTKSDVIYAGRLMDFKNVDVLIEAVALVRKKKPNIKCLIIGDGPERQKLENLSKKLTLQKNITFKGFLENHDDVYAYMKSSKVFVLPSKREGFGIAILEALACNIEVITTNSRYNFSHTLKGLNKYIRLSEADTNSIANIIESYDTTEENDNKKIMTAYSWNTISNNLDNYYFI